MPAKVRARSSKNGSRFGPADDSPVNDEAEYLAGLAPNPDYGNGSFLRAWSMRRLAPDRLRVTMEDTFHALSIVLAHDDRTILDIEANWLRHPISSCAGAAAFLSRMIGSPLETHVLSTSNPAAPPAHCTHMFDSFRLAATHLAQDRPDRRYDIVLPDRLDGPQHAQLLIDGKEALSLLIGPDMVVQAPAFLSGAPLMRGLARWARGSAAGYTFEWLFMIQRAIFVSWGRKIEMARYQGAAATIAGPPEGSCYASQSERYRDAIRLASDRPGLQREDALLF